jgi:hypothetical protein
MKKLQTLRKLLDWKSQQLMHLHLIFQNFKACLEMEEILSQVLFKLLLLMMMKFHSSIKMISIPLINKDLQLIWQSLWKDRRKLRSAHRLRIRKKKKRESLMTRLMGPNSSEDLRLKSSFSNLYWVSRSSQTSRRYHKFELWNL